MTHKERVNFIFVFDELKHSWKTLFLYHSIENLGVVVDLDIGGWMSVGVVYGCEWGCAWLCAELNNYLHITTHPLTLIPIPSNEDGSGCVGGWKGLSICLTDIRTHPPPHPAHYFKYYKFSRKEVGCWKVKVQISRLNLPFLQKIEQSIFDFFWELKPDRLKILVARSHSVC